MPSDSAMYCFNRKKDAESLAKIIDRKGGKLGYCTIVHSGGRYSVLNPLSGALNSNLTFAEMLEFILRKWW